MAILSSLSTAPGCGNHDQAPAPTDSVDADVPPVKKDPPVPVAPVFIGTGGFAYGFGSAFAGAAAPQGLAKVGPDTKGPWGTVNFLHYSGYWYGDDTIQGFSHLHLHGTGACDYGVLTLMPTDAVVDPTRTKPKGYESHFAKSSESGVPGYYAVTLDRGNIKVELTATPHAGHHRYTYPASATEAHVLFDLDHHLNGGSVKDADVTLFPDEKRIRGRLRSVGQMSNGFGGYDVFFEARTKRAWKAASTWSGDAPPAAGTSVAGSGVGLALDFDLAADHSPIELQVGVSLISGDAAAANLKAEMETFAFDDTRKKTEGDWAALTSAVKFDGGSVDARNMMTAALYHAFLMPTRMGDADGSYRAIDGSVKKADGFRYVSDMSLWDTYRTVHPLYALIARDRGRDAVMSLIDMAKVRGGFPRWPIATGEAGTMIGDSAEVVLTDAYLKGITDFDAAASYAMFRAAALDPATKDIARGGRSDDTPKYMSLGFVPASQSGSVSRTMEYAQEDFALAQLATALGHADDAAKLSARAHGWQKLFDPATGYLWGKKEDGTWSGAHDDPTDFGKDFVEADAAQSLWGAPHDLDGYVALFGTKEKMVEKLSELFEKGKQDYDQLDPKDTLRSAGPRPWFWAGNEPDIHAVYMFAQAGRPDLTQKWLNWVMTDRFGPGADGLPGNDDGGTMSSWWVFGAIGFYPLAGTDRYTVGAPMFPHLELSVGGGKFVIDAPAVSTVNIYVQSVTLDGAPLTKPEIKHANLHAGGSLQFEMGPKPSTWGR